MASMPSCSSRNRRLAADSVTWGEELSDEERMVQGGEGPEGDVAEERGGEGGRGGSWVAAVVVVGNG